MLSAISIILYVVVGIYATFILYVYWTWNRIPAFKNVNKASNENTEVLIPVKNEGDTIVDCVASIIASEHQISTITVINDGSTDQTIDVVKNTLRSGDKILNTSAEAHGKKHAINIGIQQSDADFILTTDGDCVVSNQWSEHMISALRSADLILGPVFVKNPKGLTGQFQQFDFVATMALSQVAQYRNWFFSGSATSMAYRRDYFSKLNPYTDNIHIPSGDDIFLIEKVIQDGGTIHFIKNKNTYVLTEAVPSWSGLWQQRSRWASKTKHYKKGGINLFWIGIGIVLLCFCASVVLLGSTGTIGVFLFAWGIKALVDFLLIRRVVTFYSLPVNYLFFIPCLFIYPFFIVGLGLSSLFRAADRW